MSDEIESAGTGEPPGAKPPNYARRTRCWGALTIVSAIGIVLPPLSGLAITVFSMISAFGTLSEAEGTADPEVLAGNISTALVSTATGLVVSAIFLVLFLISMVLWLINLSAKSNAERLTSEAEA